MPRKGGRIYYPLGSDMLYAPQSIGQKEREQSVICTNSSVVLELIDPSVEATGQQASGDVAPLARQEILYRLLSGPSGSRRLEICRNGSPSNRIAEAADWIKKHFTEGFMVGALAHHVGMSPTSFHQHFKSVTGMTPIQYQRRIRLQEARKCLLIESINIGEASARAGYESHSQFSKDYRRYFGRLPKDDVAAHLQGGVSIDTYAPEASVRL